MFEAQNELVSIVFGKISCLAKALAWPKIVLGKSTCRQKKLEEGLVVLARQQLLQSCGLACTARASKRTGLGLNHTFTEHI